MSVMAVFWITLAVSTLLGSIVSALHYSLRDFSLVRLQQLVEKRGRGDAVDRVLNDVDGNVLATGALRVLCTVAIALSCAVLFGIFTTVTGEDGSPVLQAEAVRFAGATLGAFAIIYVFCVVLPVSIAEHAGERLIFGFTGPLRAVHVLAAPLRAVAFVDVAVKRLAGVAHITEAEEAEDDILSAVSEGEREGSIGEEERVMIEGVVEMRSRTVEEIMTPRTEIEGFELTDDLEFIRKFIEDAGHSRIPVYEGDLDHICGILYVKDLLSLLGRDTDGFELEPILRTPVWVPETKPLSEMMLELRARKVHMAIVLDEYGGTTGLVTFEDILEEIVGEIQDEFEPASETPPEISVDAGAGTAEVDARAYIDDANEQLKTIGVEIPETEDYDTVGGYVLAALGHIPVAGETLDAPGFGVRVLEAEPTRVTRLHIEARPEEATEAGPNGNGRNGAGAEKGDAAPADRSPVK